MRPSLFLIALVLITIASCSKKAVPAKTKETVVTDVPKPVPTTPAPTTPAINSVALFSTNCAKCHGANGSEGRAPDLTKGGHSRPEIADIIANGQGHMPAFGQKLSQNEIAALSDFVAKLSK